MTPNKTFVVIFVNINKSFIGFLNLLGNSMYMLLDNGLKIEIFTYSVITDSVTQTDPSLI